MSPLSAINISNDDLSVVTSDSLGKIHQWHSFMTIPVSTTKHWHSESVNAILMIDSMMLTGGKEGVIALWHLETQKKSFIS